MSANLTTIENRMEIYEKRLSNLENWKTIFDNHLKLLEKKKQLQQKTKQIDKLLEMSIKVINDFTDVDNIDNGDIDLSVKYLAEEITKISTKPICIKTILHYSLNAIIDCQKRIVNTIDYFNFLKMLGLSKNE
tara:strand:+ start:517 stop:915 length:399 start_codon:yes stop_codon:yes gene_type:complete